MTSCNVCRSFNTVMNNQLLNNERKEIGTTFNDKNIKQMNFCSAVFSASKASDKSERLFKYWPPGSVDLGELVCSDHRKAVINANIF